MFFSSSFVNPMICLSFVECYRCYFCGMRDKRKSKGEQITLREIRNLSDENCQRTSKDTDNLQKTFVDNVQ